MVANLSVVKNKAGNDLLRRGEGGVESRVVDEAEVPSEDMKGAFVGFHGVYLLQGIISWPASFLARRRGFVKACWGGGERVVFL